MVARTESIGLMSMACFSLETCSRLRTISSVGICATPTFDGGGATMPPDGNVMGFILSAACRNKPMPTAAAQEVWTTSFSILAIRSRPFLCHLVRGFPFNVRHPFFNFLGIRSFMSIINSFNSCYSCSKRKGPTYLPSGGGIAIRP